jgi:hypothetical protein
MIFGRHGMLQDHDLRLWLCKFWLFFIYVIYIWLFVQPSDNQVTTPSDYPCLLSTDILPTVSQNNLAMLCNRWRPNNLLVTIMLWNIADDECLRWSVDVSCNCTFWCWNIVYFELVLNCTVLNWCWTGVELTPRGSTQSPSGLYPLGDVTPVCRTRPQGWIWEKFDPHGDLSGANVVPVGMVGAGIVHCFPSPFTCSPVAHRASTASTA